MRRQPWRICGLVCRWREIHSSVDDIPLNFLLISSLAITDYVCTLKSCKRVWEEKTDGGSMELQRIGMKSRKRSPGQDLLMGRPGGKKSGKRGMGGMRLC